MDTQLKKGLLDACILSFLSRGESYGYKIIDDTKNVIEISESTLYPILKRLEQNGYLITLSREHNGRLRKYYKISAAGISRLKEYKLDWLKMKQIYKKIFEDSEEL